jgi:endogenous inhibitor of DNA gyrase (YacG/DUF329 family)
MPTETSLQCPICKSPVEGPAKNSWFPFCSNRCKVVDLSKWLNNEYTVPAVEVDEMDISPEGEEGDGRQNLH